jgi:hypothetical protein
MQNMKILRAIGLGIGIIVLRFLVPEIFHAITDTLLSFFSVLQHTLSAISTDALSGNVHNFINPGFYPQIPMTQ